jgi:hypothetical protein
MTNDKQLKALLDTIERNLTDWIPIGVKELGIKSPAYCLFLWYQDFSDDFTPHYGIATQELLDAIESTHFADPQTPRACSRSQFFVSSPRLAQRVVS